MADYYIDEFQNYLEQLCTQNKLVGHGAGGKKSFARFQSDEEMNELARNAGKNIVVVANFFGRSTGSADEQAMRHYATLRFACHSANTNTTGINAAIIRAWDIMWQFVARMRKDMQEDDCPPAELAFHDMNWDPIDGPWLENHYGWDLTLPFKSYQPAYDAADWQP